MIDVSIVVKRMVRSSAMSRMLSWCGLAIVVVVFSGCCRKEDFRLPNLSRTGVDQAQPVRSEAGVGSYQRYAEVPKQYADITNSLGSDQVTLTAGRELFGVNCVVCHGEGGKGDGPWAENLPVKLPDLTSARIQNDVSDAFLYWRISEGIIENSMPSFKKLSENDRWRLVIHIRELSID